MINYTVLHKNVNKKERDVAQLGRAPGLGPGGRRFESCHPDLKAKVPGRQMDGSHLLSGAFAIF
jgi:hypothetical protein